MTHIFRRETFLPIPLPVVFDFFSRAENLEAITPPWLQFRIETPPPIAMRAGARIRYRLRLHGIPLGWLTEIEKWDPPREFIDLQIKGPYRLWRHRHRFRERDGGTVMEDRIEYALPFGALGRLVNAVWVARDVARIFDYRGQRIRQLLAP